MGELLDINPATLRNWIEDAERSSKSAGRGGEDVVDPAEPPSWKEAMAV